jgi:hypothetical protein
MALGSGSRVFGVLASVAVVASSIGCDSKGSRLRSASPPVISDDVHNRGTPGFYWLPPLAPITAYGGTFKPGLSPVVSVDALPLDPARPPVARFTTSSGTGGATIQADSVSHYGVSWDTKLSALDPSVTYRIRVALENFELGFADLDVVASGSELKNVATGEFVPLLDGRTLPIKFRIEPAALLCVGVYCKPLDQCHVAGTCDPFNGLCSNPEKPNDTACDDGNACTQTDACQGGACMGANPVACTALDQCHDAGTCEPATGFCSNPNKPENTACNDGSACTQVDVCRAGLCMGTNPITCTALDQCHDAGACDPSTGQCSQPAKPDGFTCSDGNACSQTDTCVAGACVGANPVTCTALDQCHDAGACDPSTGQCSQPAKPDGFACSDGNACTRTDTCITGACVGADAVTCAPTNECWTEGTCNPATGTCSNVPKPTGTPCSDHDACTDGDSCSAGTCVSGNALNCDDEKACTADACDPSRGCVHFPSLACSNLPDDVIITAASIQNSPLHANQRIDVDLSLQSPFIRSNWVGEFFLLPERTADNVDAELPLFPLGAWTFATVTGSGDFTIQLAIPPDVPPGVYTLMGHQYPDGAYADASWNATTYTVQADAAKPLVDVTGVWPTQKALLLDAASTVSDVLVRAPTPFMATFSVVARNADAAGVPARAWLMTPGGRVPLVLWDRAQTRYVDALTLPALHANVPTSHLVELGIAESVAAGLRGSLPDPYPTTVVIEVNEGAGSVAEDACSASAIGTARCRHALETPAIASAPNVLLSPSSVARQAVHTMLTSSATPDPLSYRGSYHLGAENEYVGASMTLSGGADLTQQGYAADTGADLNVKFWGNEFTLASAQLDASAPLGGNADISYSIVLMNEVKVPDPIAPAPSVATGTISESYESLGHVLYTDTFVIVVVPVTIHAGVNFGAGITGSASAQGAPGNTDVDLGLSVSAHPYANVGAYVSASPGGEFAGVSLIDLTLALKMLYPTMHGNTTAQAKVARSPFGYPLQIAGSLDEQLTYDFTFLEGDLAIAVHYPTVKMCKKLGIPYPCSLPRWGTADFTLASWPGITVGNTTLASGSTSSYTLALPPCQPTVTCAGHCGTLFDGCDVVECGNTCSGYDSCGGGGTSNVCGCTPAQPCDGVSCGSRDDANCGPITCGCGPYETCGDAGRTGICGCTPIPENCFGKCGIVTDNCGTQINCGACTEVGVIPDGAWCPGGSDLISIHMDDEDSDNSNRSSGWTGALGVDNNTTWEFCRVPGEQFGNLPQLGGDDFYAVLKLSASCPRGSVEFTRYFDNEDHDNANWASSDIAPNVSTSSGTLLKFCLFSPGTGTMNEFPPIPGLMYGVFAPPGISDAFVIMRGTRYVDDEDTNNANRFTCEWATWTTTALKIVSDGPNTTVNLARVR